jgi:hypothetical protein
MADWLKNVYYTCTRRYPILSCDGKWATVDRALLQDDLVYDCATYHVYKVYTSKEHCVPSYLMLSKIADVAFSVSFNRDAVFGKAGALTYVPSVGYVYFIPHKEELEIFGPVTNADYYSRHNVAPEVAEAVKHGNYKEVVRLIEANGHRAI